jgi:hypothetical protein
MITVNSVSGGKTSAYLAANYPADYNIFALVRIEDKENLWMKGKDEKTRQLVSDKIDAEFIGTAEMDEIIYTILDLEQFIGKEITWVTGKTFEQVIKEAGGYLPNQQARFCTSKMKIEPIFNFLYGKVEFPLEMRIGYRFGEPRELNRAEKMLAKADENGIEHFETIIGKRKSQNKWGLIPYRIAKFPLIENHVAKDTIYNFWQNKPVRFAYRNNCVGCVNREPLMISHMASKDLDKVKWFEKQEIKTGNRFLFNVSFTQILKYSKQGVLFNDDDFNDCDSGYCGL